MSHGEPLARREAQQLQPGARDGDGLAAETLDYAATEAAFNWAYGADAGWVPFTTEDVVAVMRRLRLNVVALTDDVEPWPGGTLVDWVGDYYVNVVNEGVLDAVAPTRTEERRAIEALVDGRS